jgi:hypothetical protein
MSGFVLFWLLERWRGRFPCLLIIVFAFHSLDNCNGIVGASSSLRAKMASCMNKVTLLHRCIPMDTLQPRFEH